MKKYQVFRSFRNLNKDVKKHELVAVEYGDNIHAITDTLIKLKAVGLFVKDMATMVAFYRDVVGFPLEWDSSDPSVIMEHDGLRFLLFGRNDFEKLTGQKYTYPSGTNGTFELAMDVDTPEEVDQEYHRMVSKGATPIIEPKTYPWGLRSCYVADPEGNLIEIATWKSQNA